MLWKGYLSLTLSVEEDYPERFLQRCGLTLADRNRANIDVQAGSDNEDEANLLGNLNGLNLNDDEEEEEESDEEYAPDIDGHVSPIDEDNLKTPSKKDKSTKETFIYLFNSTFMRVFDFCQPGRTIGADDLTQTRDMITLSICLPGGAQINHAELEIVNNDTIKISWNYHPGSFIAEQVAVGALKQDKGYLDYLQRRLSKAWKDITDKNGRLGESEEYKLKDLPEGKKISQAEGFINPHTFLPPVGGDPIYVNVMRFNDLDNTTEAGFIVAYVLVEKDRTASIRRNRFRNCEVTRPQIESLPTAMLDEVAAAIAASTPNGGNV